MRKASLLCALLIFAAVACQAQDIPERAGTSGLSFLKIGIGARAIGMGEAFTAISGDINSIYWNPAGLAQTQGGNLTFMHNWWFWDMSSDFLAVAFKVRKNTVGISLTSSRVPGIELRDKPTAEPIGTFDAQDLALAASFARGFIGFDVGITIKWLYEKIYTQQASGLGFDIGGTYFLNNKLQFGTVLSNLGAKMKFQEAEFSLPLVYRLGMVYRTKEDHLDGDIILGLDLVKPHDNDWKLHSGIEYSYNKTLALRMGYELGYDDKSFSFGLGLGYEGYKIDYAFVPFGSDLGSTHRISLGMKI